MLPSTHASNTGDVYPKLVIRPPIFGSAVPRGPLLAAARGGRGVVPAIFKDGVSMAPSCQVVNSKAVACAAAHRRCILDRPSGATPYAKEVTRLSRLYGSKMEGSAYKLMW